MRSLWIAALLIAVPAWAQTPEPLPTDPVALPWGSATQPGPNGIIVGAPSLDTLIDSVTSDTIADLTAGKALFDAEKDTVASACYGAILAQLQAMKAAKALKGLPKAHVFYSIAVAREFVLAAGPNGALENSCAALEKQTSQSALNLVNGAVTGALKVGPLFGLP